MEKRGLFSGLLMLLLIITACSAAAVVFNPNFWELYGSLQPQPAEAIGFNTVPAGHTIATIEEYDPNEYYRVVSGTEHQVEYMEYQYLPCELENCVPNSIRYGVESYGGCMAVLSKDGSLMIDLNQCGPFFDGTMP